VPKYDAFGREIGEETLQGLGETSKPAEDTDWERQRAEREAAWQNAEPAPRAEPVNAPSFPPGEGPAAEGPAEAVRPDAEQRRALAAQITTALKQAEAAKRAAPQFTTTRRKSTGRGCLVATVVFLSIIGLLIAGIVGFVSSVDVKSGSDSAVTVTPAEPAPKGLAGKSLVPAENFGPALRQIRAKGGGRLTNLRVAPERIDAQLLTPQGRLRSVQVKPGGALERFGPDSGPGFDTVNTIPFARINQTAPQRLARAGAERLKVPLSTLQYLVPTFSSGNLTWVAYFEHGRYVLGDARGRFERAF
jgi:hypothetical protein